MENKVSIYDLTDGYMNILELMRDGNEDLKSVLEQIDDAIEVKAENYAKIRATLKGDIYALKEEELRIQMRRKVLENNVNRLVENLEKCMILCDKKKFKTPLYSFNIQKNNATLLVENEDNIPDEYFIIERKLKSKELKDDIKNNGLEIDGVKIVQTESLRIR